MGLRRTLSRAAIAAIAVSGALAGIADARQHAAGGHGSIRAAHGWAHGGGFAAHGRHGHGYSIARYYGGGGLQCVPFARENTGIELAGNAANWWENAEGVYQRGARPEVGSVLNFRANGRMRMGHVAVVSNVIDGRNIEIDHANWSGRGVVGRNINVVDVSPGNDWSAVRVELGHGGEFGSIYPTYGFIYDRPDHGTMLANTATGPALGSVTARPAAARDEIASNIQDNEEVAEAADDAQPRLRRAFYRHGARHDAFRESFASRRGPGHAHAGAGHAAMVRTHELGAAHAHHGPRRRT